MKKVKYILLLIITTIFFSGCSIFKRDVMEGITIITTTYTNEYVINYLYGEYAIVNSIYPDDTNTDTYTFTDKQIRDNSSKDLFVYMAQTKDSDIAITYLNKNNDLKLINSTFEMSYENGEEELWMIPHNVIKMSENIKSGLCEYLTSSYLIKEIENNHQNLKIELSELDAEFRVSLENAESKTIFTNSKSLNYLKAYGINVIVVSSDDSQYEKNLNLLKNNIKNNDIEYFYNLEYSSVPKDVQKLIDNKEIKLLTIRNLKNITDDERNNNIDYIDLSKQNLELLKKELY